MPSVVILQPSYLPWLGYFEQLVYADVFVFYDDVQYDKHGWRNRNRIKTPQGPQWLTVPVLTRGRTGETIHAARIDNRGPWARKHLAALQTYYARAPFFQLLRAELELELLRGWESLAELDEALIRGLNRLLGIATPLYRASELGIQGGQTERLVRICQHFEADRYFTGGAARCYLDTAQFERAGIAVEFQEYRHPVYRQLHGDFLSHLSVVDLIANEGATSLPILCTKGILAAT